MLNFNKEKIDIWQVLATGNLPVAVYGTGNGADKVLDEFERIGIKPAAVFASNGFVRSRQFRGYTVESFDSVKERLGNFVVAVAFASCIDSVMQNIASIAAEYKTLVACVPVYGDKIFNSDFAVNHEKELDEAYNLMADEESKKVFAGAVDFQLSGKLDYLYRITSPKNEAFDKILKLHHGESYLDLGAYKGDTIEEFLHYTDSKYKSITAVEPNPKTFKKLLVNCENLKDSRFINIAVADSDNVVSFDTRAGRGAHTDSGNTTVQCKTIDEICNEQIPTYIKMDVEGNEFSALTGAAKTLKNYKPKLNIAAYHCCEDIFKLPLLINSINPDYKIYLRKHPYIPCWDLNLYCI